MRVISLISVLRMEHVWMDGMTERVRGWENPSVLHLILHASVLNHVRTYPEPGAPWNRSYYYV